MSPDPLERVFARFVQERIKPLVDGVLVDKSAALRRAVGAAILVFLLMTGVMFLLLGPSRRLPGGDGLVLWAVMVAIPATFAVLAFGLAFLLPLHRRVAAFRTALAEETAAFIHPALSCDRNHAIAKQAFAESLLFPDGTVPATAPYSFGGEVQGMAVRLCEVVPQTARNGRRNPAGVFFTAALPGKPSFPALSFPAGADVSLSGLREMLETGGHSGGELVRVEDAGGRQRVTDAAAPAGYGQFSPGISAQIEHMERVHGGVLSISCLGGVVFARVAWTGGEEAEGGIFEALDFGRMREFCRAAALCLAAAREVAVPCRSGEPAAGPDQA